MRRSRRGGGFLRAEEVAASAGSLLPARGEGRHLVALAAWRAAVGEQVSRATRVAGLDSGVLRVDVPDRAWGDSLRRLEAEILSRVRGSLGDRAPRRIEFRVAPGFWRPGRGPARRRGAEAAPVAETRSAGDPAGAPGSAVRNDIPRSGDEAVLRESDLPVADAALRAALCRVANRYLRVRRP